MNHIIDIVQAVTGPLKSPALQNAQSVIGSLEKYGDTFGLLVPHRLAQFLPQILHESGNFRYDKEIWGPTPAQKRYDTRKDLGNTPAVDGDGFLYRGRAGIQVTGKANYTAYRDWCRANISPDAPDFVADPDAILTDPWEGIAPIWYWSTRNLNRYADSGNNEMIRRKINGGTNGLTECLDLYTKVALVMLGFKPDDIRAFQAGAKGDGLYKGDVDGLDGPQTRSALHMALAALSDTKVTAGPVVETKIEPVTPPALDKPLTQTAGFWERITQLGGLTSIAALSAFFKEWQVVLVICGFLMVGSIVGLILHKQIVDTVKSVKEAFKS
jgi:putative chitinase